MDNINAVACCVDDDGVYDIGTAGIDVSDNVFSNIGGVDDGNVVVAPNDGTDDGGNVDPNDAACGDNDIVRPNIGIAVGEGEDNVAANATMDEGDEMVVAKDGMDDDMSGIDDDDDDSVRSNNGIDDVVNDNVAPNDSGMNGAVAPNLGVTSGVVDSDTSVALIIGVTGSSSGVSDTTGVDGSDMAWPSSDKRAVVAGEITSDRASEHASVRGDDGAGCGGDTRTISAISTSACGASSSTGAFASNADMTACFILISLMARFIFSLVLTGGAMAAAYASTIHAAMCTTERRHSSTTHTSRKMAKNV